MTTAQTAGTGLTETQQAIYDALWSGKTAEQIAKKLDTTVALVNANITRMTNKGFKVSTGATGGSPQTPTSSNPVNIPVSEFAKAPQTPPPLPTSKDSLGQVMDNLSGVAMDAEGLKNLAEKLAGKNPTKDVHPMILLGVAIQFVKFCGGRMAAHQIIEDVYSALREFVGDTTPDAGGETEPTLYSVQKDNERLQKDNERLRQELQSKQ